MQGGQREALLEERCREDPLLRQEIENLLAAEEMAGTFLDSPLHSWLVSSTSGVAPRQLGAYRVLQEVGSGGMSTVYRGERADGHFQKTVAIKLLSALDSDESRKRFLRERQLLADLDHPNIIRLIDGGLCEDGRPFLVTEYVDGATISTYARALTIRQRLELFLPVCDAVAYAHDRKIVHRDLKPSNIMVTKDGVPKLLDFGFARLLEPEIHEPRTRTRSLLLTPEYAAPEQMLAQAATPLSDLYSLALVLCEMLLGHRPERSPDGKPDLAALPRALRIILEKALRTRPEHRYQSVPEFATALRRYGHGSKARKASWFGAAVALFAISAWMGYRLFPPRILGSIPVEVVPVTASAGNETHPAISPDGKYVVYSVVTNASRGFYMKSLATGAVLKLLDKTAQSPHWSPDGSTIAFLSWAPGENWDVMLIRPDGNGLRRLTQIQSNGLAWSPDGESLLLADRDLPSDPFSIYQMPLSGGESRRLTFPPPGYWGDIFVTPAPDSSRFAFSRHKNKGDGDVYISTWDGSDVRRLTREGCWMTELSFTPDGKQIVVHAARKDGSGLWQLPAGGGPLRRVPGTTDLDGTPTFSRPQRKESADLVFERQLQRSRLRRMDLETSRIDEVRNIANSETPDWSPDGKQIIFASNGGVTGEIWISAADGSGAHPITHLQSFYATREPRWSPDAKHIAFTSAASGHRAVYVMDAESGEARRLTQDPFNEGSPTWSADGRYIYFRSERSGVPRLYKIDWQGHTTTPAPVGNGGFEALESPDGQRVYFLKSGDRSKLCWIPATGGPEVEVRDIPLIEPGLWGVTAGGIYFLTVDSEFCVIPYTRGHFQVLAHLPVSRARISGLSLGGDGKTLLWGQWEYMVGVWMIRNYRWWAY